MNHMSLANTTRKAAFLVLLLSLLAAESQVLGAAKIAGDWEVTMDFRGRQFFAKLSLSESPDGTLVGTWGGSELSDVKFEDRTLTFVRVRKRGDREFKTTYKGTLTDGKLIGTLTSERGSFPANGARMKAKPAILGQWDIKMTFRERQVSSRLSVSQKPDGTLAGMWKSRRGESPLSDVQFANNKLTFARKRTYQGQERVSTYEGTVEGNTLVGKFTSSRGSRPANGQRVGVELIGAWKLTTTSERGTRTRTLTVYPDLTGRYQLRDAEVAVKDLKLEADQVTFEIQFGSAEQPFLVQFKGTLAEGTLKGQITSPRGNSEAIGKKIETASSPAGTSGPGDGRNWAQWHGPNRDAKSAETGLLKQWPADGPRLLWSTTGLGTGFSTVSIADGLVYATGMIDNQGTLFAFDLQGNPKWKKPYGPEWTGNRPGTRSTPTVDQGYVYLISGMGAVTCFDAKTGDKQWTVDVADEFKGKPGRWGFSESLLIVKDLIICTPGGETATVVALDRKTGNTVWKTKSIGEQSAYCSPLLVRRGTRNLIVTMTAHSVVGVDAANGDMLWQYDCKRYQGKPKAINPNTPIYQDGSIYVTSGYGKGGAKLKLSEDGSEVVGQEWKNVTLDCHHGGVVLVDGHIYGTNMKGNWVCLNWGTGEVTYNTKGIGKGSIAYADGLLYCYDEKEGKVALVEPSPQDFDIVSSFTIAGGTGQHWAHPVICDGRLYIRHGDALMAYDIAPVRAVAR